MSDEYRARAIVEFDGMIMYSIDHSLEKIKNIHGGINLSHAECNEYLLENIKEKLSSLQLLSRKNTPFKYIDVSASAETIFNELPKVGELCDIVARKKEIIRIELESRGQKHLVDIEIDKMLNETLLNIGIRAYFFDTAFEFPLSLSVPIGTETSVKNLCKKLQYEGAHSGFADRFREFLEKESNAWAD